MDEMEIQNLTDQKLEELIQGKTRTLEKWGPKFHDGGEKIRILIERLLEEKERRFLRRISKTKRKACQVHDSSLPLVVCRDLGKERQLLESEKRKKDDCYEVDGTLGLIRLDCPMKGVDAAKELKPGTVEEHNYGKPLSKVHPIENNQEDNHKICVANTTQIIDKPEDDWDIIVAEVFKGISFAGSVVAFEQVRSTEDFKIVINGLVIDSELSKNVQGKYYELCCSQQSFLHDRLLEGLNCKLAAGIISQTVNIADAIKSSKITTSIEHFSIWGQTLKAFEDLGMNVGFLRAQLDRLVNLATKLNSYRVAKRKRNTLEENVRSLVVKLLEAKEAVTKLDDEIGTLEKNGANFELMFQEIVNAPW